ncbi:MAG: efflux RND transporter permease subunit, partial [Planctomycetaceae bacterium]|nr:efflux RND transporter permease subunit [Planctomycetaceae bacterium]
MLGIGGGEGHGGGAPEEGGAKLWVARIGVFGAGYLAGWLLSRPVLAVLGGFLRGFNRVFDGLAAAYGATTRGLLKISLLLLLVYGGLLGLTWAGFTGLPKGFIPDQDKGYLVVNVQLPEGASLSGGEPLADRGAGEEARRGGAGGEGGRAHHRAPGLLGGPVHEPLQRGRHVRHPRPLRGAQARPVPRRPGGHEGPAGEVLRPPRGRGRHLRRTPRRGHRVHGRVQGPGAGPPRGRPRRPPGGRPGPGRRGDGGAGDPGAVLLLHRRPAPALRRGGPGEGEGPRRLAQRRQPDPPDLPRLLLRERLHLPEPQLAGEPPGRPGLPPPGRGHREAGDAQRLR